MNDPLVPVNRKMDPVIRECFCCECGLIAPSWFHRNFIMHSDGFTCIWCMRFEDGRVLLDLPPKPSGPYRT